MPDTELESVQRFFWGAVVVRKAVTRADVEAIFVGDARLGAIERLGIYAEMYIRRLVDALSAEFPATRAVLGDDTFEALGRAYIEVHPSEHHSVAHVGRELSPFLRRLRRRALSRLHPRLARRDLAELAMLERARSVAFDTVDTTPARFEDLTELAPARLPDARLVATPSAALFTFGHDVAATWHAAVHDEPPAAVRVCRQRLLVYRDGFVVRHREVGAREGAALESMLAGETVAAVCEAFASHSNPAGAAIACIREWFAHGVVASVA